MDATEFLEGLRKRWIDSGAPQGAIQPIDDALEEIADKQSTFDLRWKADMRAIKIWQAAHPDKEDVWPDHADLCVWLLEQYEPLQKIGEAAYHLLGVYRPPDFAPGAFKTAWRKLDELVSERNR